MARFPRAPPLSSKEAKVFLWSVPVLDEIAVAIYQAMVD
jgi:hypothetical protein